MNDKATADEAEVLRLHGKEYAELYQKKNHRRVTRLIPLMNESSFGVVADIGCGTGMLLDALEDRFSLYHGVDPRPTCWRTPDKGKCRELSKVSWHQEDIVSFSRADLTPSITSLWIFQNMLTMTTRYGFSKELQHFKLAQFLRITQQGIHH